MPFVLILAGIVLLVAAVRNTQQVLYTLIVRDFTGENNFVYWVLSILIIGAIGYIPRLKPISDGFLILLILVLFLTRGRGIFDQFQSQVAAAAKSGPAAPAAAGTPIAGSTAAPAAPGVTGRPTSVAR